MNVADKLEEAIIFFNLHMDEAGIDCRIHTIAIEDHALHCLKNDTRLWCKTVTQIPSDDPRPRFHNVILARKEGGR